MLRCLLLLLALHASAGLVLAPASAPRAVGGRAAAVSMAHHVQKKATKHHASSRPKTSRLSDRNRRPPSYPSLPEKPWMTPVDSLSGAKKQTVTITVAPGDDVASLKTKLSAAGASAEEFVFQGTPVTGTLADAGLEAEASFEAVVKEFHMGEQQVCGTRAERAAALHLPRLTPTSSSSTSSNRCQRAWRSA